MRFTRWEIVLRRCSGQAAANRMIVGPVPSARAQPARAEPLPVQSVKQPQLDLHSRLHGIWQPSDEAHDRHARKEAKEEAMTGATGSPGWTAAQDLVPSVLCGQLAVLRSREGSRVTGHVPLAWTEEHRQAGDRERRAA